MLILNSFSFEDKDPRFTRLALRLLIKGLFYIRATYVLSHFLVQFIIKSYNIADNLCTKQENLGLKSVVYNQERFIMLRVLLVL